jgi:hypothetical protein
MAKWGQARTLANVLVLVHLYASQNVAVVGRRPFVVYLPWSAQPGLTPEDEEALVRRIAGEPKELRVCLPDGSCGRWAWCTYTDVS